MLGQHCVKVILIGGPGVGKTNLVNAYFKRPVDPQTFPTVAPASCSAKIIVNEREVELQIWDTAGQERFQSISRMFYRDSNVAFVCADYARFPTIDSWVPPLLEEAPDCVIFLVTTKADLLTPQELAENREQAREMKAKLKARFHIVTSAKTGAGVQELFREAASVAPEIYAVNTPVVDVAEGTSQGSGCC
jgi:small GTP-binding protein